MAVVTLTEAHHAPQPGLRCGSGVGREAYTTNFGFKTLKGAICTSSDNDDAIITVGISGGDGTMGMVDDAGADITADTTFFYVAWGD